MDSGGRVAREVSEVGGSGGSLPRRPRVLLDERAARGHDGERQDDLSRPSLLWLPRSAPNDAHGQAGNGSGIPFPGRTRVGAEPSGSKGRLQGYRRPRGRNHEPRVRLFRLADDSHPKNPSHNAQGQAPRDTETQPGERGSTLRTESLAEDLKATGLSTDQASLYVRLLQTGPAKVGQLSQYFELSRSTLYRLLDELVEAGYVSKSLERPAIFTPTDPGQMFRLSLEAADRTRDRIAHVRDERLEALQELARQKEDRKGGAHWQKIVGTDRIYKCVHEMAEAAEESICGASNHEVTTALLPAVEEAWRIVCRRATVDCVDVRLLFDFEKYGQEDMPDWLSPTETLTFRQIDADKTIDFMVFDGEELLMWIQPAALGTLGKKDDIAVKTNTPGSVNAHRMLFDELWAKGKPVEVPT